MPALSSAEPWDPRPTRTRHLVLAWFCAAAVVAYVQRFAISVATGPIQRDLSLSETEMGWVLFAYYLGYAAGQIPAGWLGHRRGTRMALPLYVGLASLMCALVARTDGYRSLLAVWFLAGLTIAGIFPCCANSIAKWYPESGRALPMGFLTGAMSIGGVASTALTGLLLSLPARRDRLVEQSGAWLGSEGAAAVGRLIDLTDWRSVFVLYALPGGLWAAAFYAWFRERPQDHPRVNAAELALIRAGRPDDAGAEREPTPWRRILTSRTMSLICGQQFFRAAGYVFYATWFPKYLQQTYNVSLKESGYLTSLPLLGVVLGGFLGGPIMDAIHRSTGSRRLSRQLFGAASQFICAALVLAAWLVTTPVPAVLLIMVGSFVFAFSSCAAFALTVDVAGAHCATVFSTMNMSGNVGAAVCPLLVGWLVDVEHGLGWRWDVIPLVFAAIYLAAGACWSLLNPEGTIFDDPAR